MVHKLIILINHVIVFRCRLVCSCKVSIYPCGPPLRLGLAGSGGDYIHSNYELRIENYEFFRVAQFVIGNW